MTLRIPKSVAIPMYKGMTHSIGEDLPEELVALSLAPPVITHTELQEVLRNKIIIFLVIKDIVLSTTDSQKRVLRVKPGSLDNFTLYCRTLHVHRV